MLVLSQEGAQGWGAEMRPARVLPGPAQPRAQGAQGLSVCSWRRSGVDRTGR